MSLNDKEVDMGAYPKGASAHILLSMSLYYQVACSASTRNIGIGNLRFRKETDGSYTFSGTVEDDYGRARILGGKLDAKHMTFQLVYNTGINPDLAEEIKFELNSSIYGGWIGAFFYTPPKTGDPQRGLAVCAVIAE